MTSWISLQSSTSTGNTSTPIRTHEEENFLSIYKTGSKRELIENVNAALPFMDGDMQELAVRAL